MNMVSYKMMLNFYMFISRVEYWVFIKTNGNFVIAIDGNFSLKDVCSLQADSLSKDVEYNSLLPTCILLQ